MYEIRDARPTAGQILAVGGLFAVLFGMLSIGAGQDANWDLKHYHLYNAFQLLHGRFWVDLNAAGMQSFFNPLLDLPYYGLSTLVLADHPRALAFIMGLPNAALALGVTWIAFLVFRKSVQDISFIAVAAAIYIGASGGISISELGTTFNDIPPAALILFGLAITLHALSRVSQPERLRYGCFIASGVLFGAAAGLKLPSAIFAPAFVLALLLANGFRKSALIDICCFGTGCCLGLLVSSGWWMVQVYALTGSPVFPVFNQIFRSEWYPPIAFFDARWRTQGILQAVAFPFFWINRGHSVVTEVWYADARLAAAYVAILTLGAGAIASRVRRGTWHASWIPPGAVFLIWFIALSYLIWQMTFCVARYAVAMEALVGIPILMSVWMIASGVARSQVVRRRLIAAAMVAIALVLQLGTHYPDWGRAPFGSKVFDVGAPSLPPNALVVVSGSPNGYVIPYLTGENARFIGVTNTTMEARGYGLWNETVKRIKSHNGPILILERTDGNAPTSTLNEMGLFVDGDRCKSIPTNFDKDIRLCGAHR